MLANVPQHQASSLATGTDERDRREEGALDRGEEEPVLDLDDDDGDTAPDSPPPPDVTTKTGTVRLALLVPGPKRPTSSCRSSSSLAAKSRRR